VSNFAEVYGGLCEQVHGQSWLRSGYQSVGSEQKPSLMSEAGCVSFIFRVPSYLANCLHMFGQTTCATSPHISSYFAWGTAGWIMYEYSMSVHLHICRT
jgi:hypothetical protein